MQVGVYQNASKLHLYDDGELGEDDGEGADPREEVPHPDDARGWFGGITPEIEVELVEEV